VKEVDNIMEAYRILGIPHTSNITEITRAFRKLAKKYHPDSNPSDPQAAHHMMMKLNEAYTAIKKHLEAGYTIYRVKERKVEDEKEWDHSLRGWMEAQERARKLREEKIKLEKERAKREQEILQRFWEEVVLDKKREVEDGKYYQAIKRYAFTLISYYYRNNFQNYILRERPHIKGRFDIYLTKYKQVLTRIQHLKRACSSERFTKRSNFIFIFLKAFIEDSLNNLQKTVERRASAHRSYQEAVIAQEKFLSGYFSQEKPGRREAVEKFKNTLNSFGKFIGDYPESPLIEYAEGKIELLETFYRAFLKED